LRKRRGSDHDHRARAHLGDASPSAALLDEALDALTVGWYAAGHQRVGEVTRQLLDSAGEVRVAERFRALAPAALPGAW
jgi:hypothetical protein